MTSGGLFKRPCFCPNPAGHQHLPQMQEMTIFDTRDLIYTLLCSRSAKRSVMLKTKEFCSNWSAESDRQGSCLKLSKMLQICISWNCSPSFCIQVRDPASQRSVPQSLQHYWQYTVSQHSLPAAFGCSFTASLSKGCSESCAACPSPPRAARL